MRGSTAGITLLVICIALVALTVMRVLTTILTGVIFALALVTLGIITFGFRKKD